jgi:hypothetical protein
LLRERAFREVLRLGTGVFVRGEGRVSSWNLPKKRPFLIEKILSVPPPPKGRPRGGSIITTLIRR